MLAYILDWPEVLAVPGIVLLLGNHYEWLSDEKNLAIIICDGQYTIILQ